MKSPASSAQIAQVRVTQVPAWAVPAGAVSSDVEAAFMAGSALNALDTLVRRERAWDGAWRYRQALQAAAAIVRLMGRREEERALRDSWCLRPSGEAPGPGGDVVLAWRRLCSRSGSLDGARLRTTAALLGVAWSERLDDLPEVIEELMGFRAPAPVTAARVATAVVARQAEAEPLAWWLADLALSARMRWPLPVPILSGQIHSAVMGAGQRRARPGTEGWERAVFLAAAAGAAEACRMAAAMEINARRLEAIEPKLRSKGAGEMLALLRGDDAVPGSYSSATVTRWASRRLFERLLAAGAVRELSGRPGFRLFGL